MRLEVRIVPNARKFSVSLKDGLIKVHVHAKAEDNKANKELVDSLSDALDTKVSIASGGKSRMKTLEIEGDREAVLAKLRELAEA